MMKNNVYFIWKAFFVLCSFFVKYLNLRPEFLSLVVKRLDKKAKTNFKIYDVIN